MVRRIASHNTPSARERNIMRVIERVTARRHRGDDVADETVIAEHGDLMPELADDLSALRVVETARARADSAPGEMDSESRQASNAGGATFFDAAVLRGYQVLEVVGRGGMGVVYRARQLATHRDVAIKVMVEGPLVGPRDRARFEREAQILAKLKHPSIVTVHDTGSTPAGFFLVMDFVEGTPLDEYVRRVAPATRPLLELFVRICEAVSAAHVRGIIHRDLKPGNILIDGAGEPHLLDFGLATTTADDASASFGARSITMTGQFVGSMPWASPEQAGGLPGRVDVRSDIYSLGVILYQVLTERFPYPVVGNIRDVVDHILTTEPARPSAVDARMDDEVETIVLKCLSKDPDRRYQSAGELARDIQRYLGGEPIEAKRDSGWYVLRKFVRRHRTPVSIALAFLLVAIGFGVTMAVLYTREQREARRVRQIVAFLQETLFTASSQRLGADATLVEALDLTTQRIATDLPDQPELEAALRYTIGAAYRTLWRDDDAVYNLRIARELFGDRYGPEHPETIRATVLLGMVLAEMEQPEAVEMQREALALRRKRYGEDHALVAESEYQFAFALFRAATPPRFAEAQTHFERALALYRKRLGDEHADIARCLHAYAALFHVQNRFDEALPLYRRSLAMSRKCLGEDHQFVLECMRDYGGALRASGELDEGERLLRSVLARTPRLFGEQHVPAVMLWIAAVERQRGKRDDAMRTATGAMFHWCQWLAVQRPDEADRWTAQADALRAAIAPATSSPNATARTLADTVDAIHRAKDQPEALVRACLALARIVDPADAEPFLRIAAEIVQSDEHTPGRLRGLALAELGRFLLTQRRYADAEPLLDHAITALRDRLGAEDSTVAALEGELAGARRAANGPAAEPNLASPTDGR